MLINQSHPMLTMQPQLENMYTKPTKSSYGKPSIPHVSVK